MPRTKLAKNKNASANAAAPAIKRNRDSCLTKEEARLKALKDVNDAFDSCNCHRTYAYEASIIEFDNLIREIKNRIPENVQNLTMADLYASSLAKPSTVLAKNNDTNESIVSDLTNYSHVTTSTFARNKTLSKEDEGYLTEESGHTTRTGRRGPLSSSKAKSRRSISAHLSSTKISQTASKTMPKNVEHSSRSKYRTPIASNRLQTMSADRGMMNPVTPKMQLNNPISMLRYPKMGETVISLSGSPVVAQSAIQNIANINIPIAQGMISMQPTCITSIDSDMVSRIDSATLKQLKQLQANLNLIMNQALGKQ